MIMIVLRIIVITIQPTKNHYDNADAATNNTISNGCDQYELLVLFGMCRLRLVFVGRV